MLQPYILTGLGEGMGFGLGCRGLAIGMAELLRLRTRVHAHACVHMCLRVCVLAGCSEQGLRGVCPVGAGCTVEDMHIEHSYVLLE